MRYNKKIISQKKNEEYWNLYKILWSFFYSNKVIISTLIAIYKSIF